MAQHQNRWWDWIGFYLVGDIYFTVDYNRGYYFIRVFKCILAFINFSNLIYTFVRVYRGSKSKFAFSLMPFTFLYCAFLILSLNFSSSYIMVISESINSIVTLQSWIFSMNYLRSYLLATKEPKSKILKTHSFVFWSITIAYILYLILLVAFIPNDISILN